MDIKPVKKRRQKPISQPRRALNSGRPEGQKNITLRPKTGTSGLLNKQTKSSRFDTRGFLKKNIYLMTVLIFLSALYLPASRLINTGGQYQDLIRQSFSVDTILNNASYMPQKFFLMLTSSNGLNSSFLLKAFGFIFILLVIYLFYLACLRWLGMKTSLLITFLFSSSSWIILSSQSLDFNNTYLVFIPLAIYINYLLVESKNSLRVFAATLLFALTLYSPGMVWPILGFIALLPVFMQKILAKYNLGNIWIFLIFSTIFVLPLFASLILHPANFANVLAGDSQIAVHAFVQNIKASFEAMFINGVPDSSLWLVGTPIFNYLTSLLFIFGLVYLVTDKRLGHRFNFLATSMLFTFLAIAFVGLSALPLIVPAVYLTAGFGIKFLLKNWYAIFPSNPVARNVGLSLVIFTVLLSSGYDIARYYIAWPKANDLISAPSS